MSKPWSLFLLGRRVVARFCNHDFEGLVVGETKNTVVIQTKVGEKRIPKAVAEFRVQTDGEVKIEGRRLVGRPLERLLRGVRR
ncbi:MAG: ribonuclease P protein subunit [Candidatus Caldarchaeum sp.]